MKKIMFLFMILFCYKASAFDLTYDCLVKVKNKSPQEISKTFAQPKCHFLANYVYSLSWNITKDPKNVIFEHTTKKVLASLLAKQDEIAKDYIIYSHQACMKAYCGYVNGEGDSNLKMLRAQEDYFEGADVTDICSHSCYSDKVEKYLNGVKKCSEDASLYPLPLYIKSLIFSDISECSGNDVDIAKYSKSLEKTQHLELVDSLNSLDAKLSSGSGADGSDASGSR